MKPHLSGLSLKKKQPDVYHVSVMPCFDKKLEAARTEFESEHDGTKVRKGLNQFLTETVEIFIKNRLAVFHFYYAVSRLAYKC